METKEILEKIAEHEALAAEYKAKEISAASFKRGHENKVEELTKELLDFYLENGVQKDTVDMGLVNYILTVNQGRESVDVPDVEAVPEAFIRLTKSVDKKLVGEHLKEHSPNWATLKRGNPYLTIKAVIK